MSVIAALGVLAPWRLGALAPWRPHYCFACYIYSLACLPLLTRVDNPEALACRACTVVASLGLPDLRPRRSRQVQVALHQELVIISTCST